jgi:multidrug transporter EmrE-like cation transporter
MGHVNLLWSCVSIIIAYMIGIKFFKETHNKYTCYAILFALAAIYMSYLSDKEGFSL